MKKGNSIISAILLPMLLSILFSACVTCKEDCTQIRADYIAFSDNITPSYKMGKCVVPYLRQRSAPYDMQVEQKTFTYGIMMLKTGEKTSAYYAYDNGLDRVKNVRLKHMGRSRKARYYIITLTDGLDNNSPTLAKIKGQNKLERDAKYEAKLEKKAKKVMGNKKNRFQSYVMYYDARDSYKFDEKGDTVFYTEKEIKDMLSVFSQSINATRPEVIYVQQGKINELAKKFNEEFSTQSFGFKISKAYSGERIKMVLKDMQGQTIFIEGTFKAKGKNFYLTDVQTSDGVSYDKENINGDIAMSVYNDKRSTDVLFEIKSLKYNGTLFRVSQDKDAQKQLINYNGSWAPNVEYKADEGKITDAYVLVLLDVSRSFTVLSEAKSQIIKIMQSISTNK